MPKSKYTKGKDGRFRTAIRTGDYDENGRPILIRLSSSKSSADLERMVREKKYELEHHRKFVASDMLFGEYADRWIETKNRKSIKTREMYESILTRYIDAIKTMPLNEIRQSDIQLIINAQFHHPRTCEQILLTLRQVFEAAVDDDLIQKNPCKKIEMPRHVKQEKRALTEDEKEKIKKAEGLNELERTYLHLLMGSGMRPAEMFALEWKDIDFKNCTVRINKALQFENSRIASIGLPKTDKSIRSVPLPPFVIASLSALKRTRVYSVGSTIFGANTGELRTRSGYRNIFDSAMKKLSLSGITPYMFRHHYCTQCYLNGVDIKTCQILMGHSDINLVLTVYNHVSNQQALQTAIAKLDF